MLLRSCSFMVGDNNNNKKRQTKRVSMTLMAFLAPARVEVEAGVVAKADQNSELDTDFLEGNSSDKT